MAATADPDGGEAQALLDWLDSASSLPSEPFTLWPGIRIDSPSTFYTTLHHSLAEGWPHAIRDAQRLPTWSRAA